MKYTYPTIIVLLLITLAVVLFKQPANSEVLGEVCPVCDCRITAEKIKRDNPNIDLSFYDNATTIEIPDKKDIKIKIGDDLFTKEEIKALK